MLDVSYRKIYLGDLFNIFTGKKNVNETDPNGKYTFFSCSPESFHSNEYIYNGEAIIIAGNGSYTGTVRFFNGAFDLYQRTYALTPKDEMVDTKYVYYLLKMKFEAIYMGGSRGSSIPYIVMGDIADFEISLPPLPEQKRISSILSSFDNKIEQLKKQNNILEDIAQSIFKEWFVKYNFPNKEGKPYKNNNGKMIDSELGLIPEGWRVGKLGEICELKSGFAFKGEDFVEKSNTKVIKIKNLQGKGNIDTSNLSHIKEDVVKVERIKDFILSEGDILIAMSGNTTGKIGTMPYTDSPVYLNQRVGKLFFKNKDYHNYIYNFLMINNYEEKILNMGYGSAQPNINPSQIENIKILKPSTFLLDLYNQKTNIIYQKKRENIKNIIKLTKSKNILLNKLFQ